MVFLFKISGSSLFYGSNTELVRALELAIIIILTMPKLQILLAEQIQNVSQLVTRITHKLATLGYSKCEIQHKILAVTKSVLKLKEGSFKNLQKCLSYKVEKEELSKKSLYLLAVELDLYLNSIYDNYDSQSESNNLKLENLASVQASSKKSDLEVQRQNLMLKNQQHFESRYELLRGIARREASLEGYRNRRLFEKMERRREVKLEYLNFMNY